MGDATRWRHSGLDEPDVRNAIGFGLSVEDVVEWAPFYPLEIYWARKHRLALDEARRWAAGGVRIRDTVKALAVGLKLEEVQRWQALGFLPADAWEARESGVSLERAAAWREVGFVVPAALQLIRDGWTLEAAVIARYDGIDRYGKAI